MASADPNMSTKPPPAPRTSSRRTVGWLEQLQGRVQQLDPAVLGLVLAALALGVYLVSNSDRGNFYNHFVWQAQAYVEGRVAIDFPVSEGRHVNAYFQDVMPVPNEPGRGWIPFPPLPAVLLVPLVVLSGLDADASLLAVLIGALNVALAWRLTSLLTTNRLAALLATAFFAFGTVHWYAAMLGSTWFLAHVVAVSFVLGSIGLALDGERRMRLRAMLGRPPRSDARTPGWHPRAWFEPRQFVAGLLLGIGALARLPVIFGAPFLLFVGAGGSYRARALSAGIGAVIPVLLLVGYNLITTGHLFHPAYQFLYDHEYLGYLPPAGCYAALPAAVCDFMTINRDFAITDPRHVPLNALIMLGWPPVVRPECGLELLSRACPVVQPSPIGMSILLTSPAYLLAVPLLLSAWRRRVVVGAALAVLAIALVNLMHFSQGWVQFGYRFSNDFGPFALVLVTLAIARLGVRPLTVGLVALSVIINAWGVYWGVQLGW
jgi:hypothetical protein